MTQLHAIRPETERLRAVRRTALLDTPPTEAFDRLTRLASRFLGAPVSLMSLVCEERQFLKSAVGLPEPWATRREMPIAYSFCRHVVASARPLVVEDARRHPLVRTNPAVRELGWLAYAGVPLTSPDGLVLGALCVIDKMPRLWSDRDLDLLQDLAAALETAIELHRLVAQGLPDRSTGDEPVAGREQAGDPWGSAFDDLGLPMALIGPGGEWRRVNRAFCDLLGHRAADLLGQPARDLTHSEDRSADAEAVRLLRAGECGSYSGEKRFLSRSGDVIWAMTTATVVSVPGADAGCLHLALQDLGARKRTETRLKDDAERHRLASEVDTAVLRDWDLPTDRIEWEDAGHLLGPRPHAMGPTAGWWYERLHAEDRERVVFSLHAAIAKGDRTWRESYRFRRDDGTYVHLEDRACIQRDTGGDAVRIVGTLRDVTRLHEAELLAAGRAALVDEMAERLAELAGERVRLEEQLRPARGQAAVGQLAGAVAGDVTNLLAAIVSYSDLALEELRVGEPAREDIEQIRAAGQRAAVLTGLLAVGRRAVPRPRRLSLNSLIGARTRMLEALLGPRALLETDLEGDLWPVLADADQVEAVLAGLILHARGKPAGGRVTVSTRNRPSGVAPGGRNGGGPAGFVALAVRSSGSGAAPPSRIGHDLQSPTDDRGWEDDGLTVVRGLVAELGGQLETQTEAGGDPVVTVLLPRHTAADGAAPTGTPPGSGETVLLVEAEAAVRTSARRLLERHGYAVLEARDPGDALRIAAAGDRRIDLVMTDLPGPQSQGHELIERLRMSQPELKALFLSAASGGIVPEELPLPPRAGFVEKPFTVERLLRRLREVLDS